MKTINLLLFDYKGPLPSSAVLKNEEAAKISDDPYFLLGNYRFKLFAHVSGEYEIYSSERVISHFNMHNTLYGLPKTLNISIAPIYMPG